MPSDQSLPDIGMSDPNNTQAPNQNSGGKTKVNKTDMSGESGGHTGASFNESLASSKATMMPSEGGSDMGNIITSTPIMMFGDPNDTALDFKDGPDINVVNITGGADIERYDLNSTDSDNKQRNN